MPNSKGRRASPGEGAEPCQRADGRWQASIEIPAAGGARKRKYVYGATKTEALQRLRAVRHDLAAGKVPTTTRLTLDAYLKECLKREQDGGTRPRTIEFYMGLQEPLTALYGPYNTVQAHPRRRAGLPQRQERRRAVGHLGRAPSLRAALCPQRRHAPGAAGSQRRRARRRAPRGEAEAHGLDRAASAPQARWLLEAARGHRLEALVSVALAMRPSEYYAHVLPTLAEETSAAMDAILRPLKEAVEEAGSEAI